MSDVVRVERSGPVTTVILNRPEVRNAVNGETAKALAEAFLAFERDPDSACEENEKQASAAVTALFLISKYLSVSRSSDSMVNPNVATSGSITAPAPYFEIIEATPVRLETIAGTP